MIKMSGNKIRNWIVMGILGIIVVIIIAIIAGSTYAIKVILDSESTEAIAATEATDSTEDVFSYSLMDKYAGKGKDAEVSLLHTGDLIDRNSAATVKYVSCLDSSTNTCFAIIWTGDLALLIELLDADGTPKEYVESNSNELKTVSLAEDLYFVVEDEDNGVQYRVSRYINNYMVRTQSDGTLYIDK